MEGKTNKTNNKTKHNQYQKKKQKTTKQNINNTKKKEKITFKIEIPELTFINRYQLVCARRVSRITLIRYAQNRKQNNLKFFCRMKTKIPINDSQSALRLSM